MVAFHPIEGPFTADGAMPFGAYSPLFDEDDNDFEPDFDDEEDDFGEEDDDAEASEFDEDSDNIEDGSALILLTQQHDFATRQFVREQLRLWNLR